MLASFTAVDDLRVQSLDGTGMPKGDVPCHASEASGMTFTIGPEYKTLWYLITGPRK